MLLLSTATFYGICGIARKAENGITASNINATIGVPPVAEVKQVDSLPD
jgi:hypothetical protein